MDHAGAALAAQPRGPRKALAIRLETPGVAAALAELGADQGRRGVNTHRVPSCDGQRLCNLSAGSVCPIVAAGQLRLQALAGPGSACLLWQGLGNQISRF
jgi:hypothetical protein